MTSNPPLKYLFIAFFADGTRIEQDLLDKSKIDPEKRSRFYDVVKHEKAAKLIRFELKGGTHTYSVDLKDGHFEVDGVAFRMDENSYDEYRVIFWRNHTHNFNVSAQKDEEISHEIVYRIGWQANDKQGQNHQRVMQIN